MVFLFEDSPTSLFATFLTKAFDPQKMPSYIFCKGASGLLQKATDIVSSNQEEVVIPFLDVVYDNVMTYSHYIGFCSLFKKFGGRVVPIPVVCTEHTFVRSISNMDLVKDAESYRICVEALDWHQSGLIQTPEDIKSAKNFEHFCKLFMMKGVVPCLSTSKDQAECQSTKFLQYYTDTCRCMDALPSCGDETVAQKATLFLYQYPLVMNQNISMDQLLAANESACAYLNHLYEKHEADKNLNKTFKLLSLRSLKKR